jgi:ATP-dependent Clp endopeptidase proteolytic subunit ClpP
MRKHFTSLSPSVELPELQALLTMPGAEGKDWYRIENLSSAEAEVHIYNYIGEGGITANDFIKDFSAITAKEIALRLNSPGGQVFDGVAIYNAIRRHPANVTVYVDGLAASIASVIAMAGDKVVAMPHSQFMVHDASGLVMGNASDMREFADFLDKSSNNIAAVYAEKTGGTVEDWRDVMRAETWFSDQEAVDAGLADEIFGSSGAPPANQVKNEAVSLDPESDPEPEEPATPEPIDYSNLFSRIAREAEEALLS